MSRATGSVGCFGGKKRRLAIHSDRCTVGASQYLIKINAAPPIAEWQCSWGELIPSSQLVLGAIEWGTRCQMKRTTLLKPCFNVGHATRKLCRPISFVRIAEHGCWQMGATKKTQQQPALPKPEIQLVLKTNQG
jgi:hypothetical protein